MARTTTQGLLLLLLALGAWGGPASAQAPTEGPEYDKVKHLIERYEPAGRAKWQPPAALMRVLGVEEGDKVADIGTGTGFLLPVLSALVNQSGHVWAVDIDADALAYVKSRRFSFDNVETVLADPEDPRLPQGAADVIFVVNTWHHIAKRPAYIRKLEQALAPGGRLAIVDFLEGELPVGPPPDHKLAKAKVLKEFEKAGWHLHTDSTALPYQYFLVFAPKVAERPLSDETAYPPGVEVR